MVEAISIDRLRLRLIGSSEPEARRLATQVAEALAAGAPGLDPGLAIAAMRVRLPAAGSGAIADAGLAQRIAEMVLGRLGGEGS